MIKLKHPSFIEEFTHAELHWCQTREYNFQHNRGQKPSKVTISIDGITTEINPNIFDNKYHILQNDEYCFTIKFNRFGLNKKQYKISLELCFQ